MALGKTNPSGTVAWEKLREHFYNKMQTASMTEMFANDSTRAEKFNLQWNDFLVDYSKNIITQETIDLLLDLAKEVDLKEAISK